MTAALRAMLSVQSDRYRRLPVLAGDVEAACRLLSDHFLATMALVRDLAQQEALREAPAKSPRSRT